MKTTIIRVSCTIIAIVVSISSVASISASRGVAGKPQFRGGTDAANSSPRVLDDAPCPPDDTNPGGSFPKKGKGKKLSVGTGSLRNDI
jgi:hypothetical protein